MNSNIYTYDTFRYNFKDIICDALNVSNLETLHENSNYDVLVRETDQSTKWHERFYKNNLEFSNLYLKFVKEIIKPIFDNELLVYQTIPTFRVHLVGNVAVGEFHRDRDYGHSINETNFWIPFTNAFSTNTIWIESQEGKEDVTPCLVNYGEILKFDGPNLLHGNKINTTNITRVSVDFRVVKYLEFVPSNKTSINTNKKFDIGNYFSIV